MNTKFSRKLLVAQDNLSAYNLLHMSLDTKKIPLIMEHVLNGADAVEKIKAGERYDAILMNLEMPIMDGLRATEEIRKIDKDIPILAWSGHFRFRMWPACKEVGMNEYIEDWSSDLVEEMISKLTTTGVMKS